MTMIRNINLSTISVVANNSSPAPTSNAPDAEPPGLLPDAKLESMQHSGDVGAMIAALLIESSQHSREIARSVRDAALAAEDAAFGRKIDAMESAAQERLIGGLASGGMTIGAGTVPVAGDFMHNAPMAKSAKAWEGGAATGKTLGDFCAAQSDIEREHAERAMTQAKRNVESAGDMDKDAKDLLRRAMGYYSEYARAKDDASKAALFRA